MERKWTDERVEVAIAVLLRAGVTLAAAVVAIGGIWYLVRWGGTPGHYAQFRGEPESVSTVSGILMGLRELRPRSIIQFGLLLLIATPVLRVAFSAVAFAMQRDRTYVAVTLIVLAILLYSLMGGVAAL